MTAVIAPINTSHVNISYNYITVFELMGKAFVECIPLDRVRAMSHFGEMQRVLIHTIPQKVLVFIPYV